MFWLGGQAGFGALVFRGAEHQLEVQALFWGLNSSLGSGQQLSGWFRGLSTVLGVGHCFGGLSTISGVKHVWGVRHLLRGSVPVWGDEPWLESWALFWEAESQFGD